MTNPQLEKQLNNFLEHLVFKEGNGPNGSGSEIRYWKNGQDIPAIKALTNLIQDRERKAIKTHFRNWWTDSCRDKARVMTKVPISEYYDELNKGEK